MPLADFADTWGINELKNGHFLNSFDLPENQILRTTIFQSIIAWTIQWMVSSFKNQVFDFKKEF